MISKPGLRKKLYELLPVDNESLDQIIDYAVTLNTEEEVSQHFVSLVGSSTLVREFIRMMMKYKEQGSKRDKRGKLWKVAESEPQKRPETVKPSKLPEKSTIVTQKPVTSVKPVTQSKPVSKPKNAKEQKIHDINELDELLNKIEYGNNDESVRCNCMATRHPLNKALPNCLNCGKIVCMKESARTTCSFCGELLLSREEKDEMIRLLQQEKEDLVGLKKPVAPVQQQPKKKKKEKMVISMGSAGKQSFYKQQNSLFEQVTEKKKEEELKNAQKKLDTLLGFQENASERTKIIDQVSDYLLPGEGNLWTKSSLHRILEMKKQQRNLRKKEQLEAERSGRGQKIVSLNIKDGKVTLQEKKGPADGSLDSESLDESDDEEKQEIEELEQKIREEEKNKQKELVKKRWDFNADHEKWERRKPVYSGAPRVDEGEEFKERLQQDDISLEEMLLVV